MSEAFAEDPVRILRVARFAARFGFEVHPETMALMQRMVKEGEADYLVPERVWQEFAKGLAEPHPHLMFDVLRQSGLLQKLFPEVNAIPKNFAGSVAARFALLTWPLDEAQVNALCDRLRAPNEVRELALTAGRCRNKLAGSSPRSVTRSPEDRRRVPPPGALRRAFAGGPAGRARRRYCAHRARFARRHGGGCRRTRQACEAGPILPD